VARLIFRIWDTVDRGNGPKQVVKTFALEESTSLPALLRSAARKTDVTAQEVELVELGTGLEVRAVVDDTQLPYRLLSSTKRYGFRKHGKVLAIEMQSGPVSSVLKAPPPSHSTSDRKNRGKKSSFPVIGAPQGLQHITHVDREWTW
jgi:hypothetical protein